MLVKGFTIAKVHNLFFLRNMYECYGKNFHICKKIKTMKIKVILLAILLISFTTTQTSAQDIDNKSNQSRTFLDDVQEGLDAIGNFIDTINDLSETIHEMKSDGTLEYLTYTFASVSEDKPVFFIFNCGDLNERVWKKKKVKELLSHYIVAQINMGEGEKFEIAPVRIEPKYYYRSDLNKKTLIDYLERGLKAFEEEFGSDED